MKQMKWVLAAAVALAGVSSPVLADPSLDSLTAVSEGPSLSLSQENYANEGYADRSRVNAAKAGDKTMTLSEEGPNDSAVGLVIDPISGEILSGKKK